MNRPITKNIILIGIPTIISAIGIIISWDILSGYKNLFIILSIVLLAIFIGFIFYYGKQEDLAKMETQKLKSTITSMGKVLNINSQIVVSVIRLLEDWNRDISKIANDIKNTGTANEKNWDYESICANICVTCKNAISKFTELDSEMDLSVAFIKYYSSGSNDYIKMIAHSSPQTARPDVYDVEESLQDCMYQYARMIRDRKRDILALADNESVMHHFHKKRPDTDLSKYSQYIAIPVICSKNKYLGILQVTTKYNYKIMDSGIGLKKFSETYLTPFVELFILAEKIEKGMFAKPI